MFDIFSITHNVIVSYATSYSSLFVPYYFDMWMEENKKDLKNKKKNKKFDIFLQFWSTMVI